MIGTLVFVLIVLILVPGCVAGVVGLFSYTVFACFCRNKADGNEIHPYIAFVPIIRYTPFQGALPFPFPYTYTGKW